MDRNRHTKNREHFFGEIVEADATVETLHATSLPTTERTMRLNEIVKLAEKYWMEIPTHFPFIELGNFVVMPNHVHGILIIDKPAETLHCNVSTNTTNANENINTKNEQMAKISPKSGSISTIIRSYKSVVSKNVHLIHADFEWQSRFHDHLIHSAKSFERIQNYISTNPQNWKDDKFYN